MQDVLNDPEARISLPDLNVAYHMNTEQYYEKTHYATDLEENWESASGYLSSDGQNLVVCGKQFGTVFIVVQSCFGHK